MYFSSIIVRSFYIIRMLSYCIIKNNEKSQFYGMVVYKVVLRTACFLLYHFDISCA